MPPDLFITLERQHRGDRSPIALAEGSVCRAGSTFEQHTEASIETRSALAIGLRQAAERDHKLRMADWFGPGDGRLQVEVGGNCSRAFPYLRGVVASISAHAPRIEVRQVLGQVNQNWRELSQQQAEDGSARWDGR